MVTEVCRQPVGLFGNFLTLGVTGLGECSSGRVREMRQAYLGPTGRPSRWGKAGDPDITDLGAPRGRMSWPPGSRRRVRVFFKFFFFFFDVDHSLKVFYCILFWCCFCLLPWLLALEACGASSLTGDRKPTPCAGR